MQKPYVSQNVKTKHLSGNKCLFLTKKELNSVNFDVLNHHRVDLHKKTDV